MVTTIAVNEQTKELLKKIGHKGETYDAIIRHLIELARKQLFFDRQKRILEEDEFIDIKEI
ncbi:MAG: hypothetical protein J7K68_03700 [Candidatus Diapherotrites archaeon]|nr:hypothetical protein [Candidatus Diapherotrites archaeon]